MGGSIKYLHLLIGNWILEEVGGGGRNQFVKGKYETELEFQSWGSKRLHTKKLPGKGIDIFWNSKMKKKKKKDNSKGEKIIERPKAPNREKLQNMKVLLYLC